MFSLKKKGGEKTKESTQTSTWTPSSTEEKELMRELQQTYTSQTRNLLKSIKSISQHSGIQNVRSLSFWNGFLRSIQVELEQYKKTSPNTAVSTEAPDDVTEFVEWMYETSR